MSVYQRVSVFQKMSVFQDVSFSKCQNCQYSWICKFPKMSVFWYFGTILSPVSSFMRQPIAIDSTLYRKIANVVKICSTFDPSECSGLSRMNLETAVWTFVGQTVAWSSSLEFKIEWFKVGMYRSKSDTPSLYQAEARS